MDVGVLSPLGNLVEAEVGGGGWGSEPLLLVSWLPGGCPPGVVLRLMVMEISFEIQGIKVC